MFLPTGRTIEAKGDGREVLRRAQSVDPGGLPPYLVERRTHFLIDVARGHAHLTDDSAALATLVEAERLASDRGGQPVGLLQPR